MNKRGFILALFAIAAALTGWVVYVNAKTRQATPIEKISVDWFRLPGLSRAGWFGGICCGPARQDRISCFLRGVP